MKAICKKMSDILKTVFGYGIMITLVVGGLTFFGYVAALIIGGDLAEKICVFLQKQYYPVVIVVGALAIVVGWIAMYVGKKEGLSIKEMKK